MQVLWPSLSEDNRTQLLNFSVAMQACSSLNPRFVIMVLLHKEADLFAIPP